MPRRKPTPIETVHACSHPSRWAILQALTKPLGSHELAAQTGLSQHNIAYHGRTLRLHGLVTVKRDKSLPTRLIYSRVGFLAEVVIDYEKAGTEATFIPKTEPAPPRK